MDWILQNDIQLPWRCCMKLKLEDVEKRRKQLLEAFAFLPESERKAIVEERIAVELNLEKGVFQPLDIPSLPKDFAQRSEEFL